ncbi:ecdysteroid 22-kinase family protein [Vibrio sp. SCSIO 43136]|uniref:ecdysteroid 22-kinase family protein n=1 Tax=Vibrio sp. SCSIO 43136 TaxID=2819101 RepID=UPI00207611D6|nr:ecdysteroid 22-kinase family protein [Vibrio sp. SCSIO 43136]USD66939.1 phosphotransferase [Vibrio sp. SCSIO 43136]
MLQPFDISGVKVLSEQVIQSIWGNYGQVVRLTLQHDEYQQVVSKQIAFPQPAQHPKGWNTARSHHRKLKSFEVELNWYKHYSLQYDQHCLMPLGLQCDIDQESMNLVMSDLASLGLTQTYSQAELPLWKTCLDWLAHFHAKHFGQTGEGLWQVGGYWHLETRPDELAAMEDSPLKQHAHTIDNMLRGAKYQTLIHGDAKLANFCFSPSGDKAGAVDFQWSGKGCGIIDVALFVSSCVPLARAEQWEDELLNYYFKQLTQAFSHYGIRVDASAVETEWRSLYDVAWADFLRFVKGWSPQHWKICSYSEQKAAAVIRAIHAS